MDKVNILLVDDNPGKLLSYQAMLDPLGENILVAHSGREALQCLLKHAVALVLLDVMMPEMDGFETAGLLREHPRLAETPIVFITALSTSDLDRLKGYELGAVDYVFVPVIPEILCAKVAVFVELHRKTRELVALNRELEQRVAHRTVDLTAANSSLHAEIARRLQAEEEIRQLNQTLELRVQDRTAQLEEANRELEAFSYSVSHDLRAPLRHVGGFTEMIQKRAGGTLDETSLRYLRSIGEAAQKAGQMVDDLLMFSRLGRTEVQWKVANMEQIAEEVRRDLAPETSDRVIHWRIGPLPEARGDPALLLLVLHNLVSNAVKYTQPRVEAEIEIAGRCEDQQVVFHVRDNGAGFDMRYVDKLFRVFQRLHHNEKFEGTGIGLANVRRIISRHGGQTWAEGAVDQGATFYFSLPKAQPNAADEAYANNTVDA